MIAQIVLAVAIATQPLSSDSTFHVSRGSRLDVNNYSGDVSVVAWARDEVRITTHAVGGGSVSVTRSGSVISLSQAVSAGRAGAGDMNFQANRPRPSFNVRVEISAPAWMPIEVVGNYGGITVSGFKSPVTAETVDGDVRITNGSEHIVARSLAQNTYVTDSRGAVEITSPGRNIIVSRIAGSVRVRTIVGQVDLEDLDCDRVDVTTITGSIWLKGAPQKGSDLRLSTHSGSVTVGLPQLPRSGATIEVSTVQGSIDAVLPEMEHPEKSAGRTRYTLGDGSAQIEVDSFKGSIRFVRPSEKPAREE